MSKMKRAGDEQDTSKRAAPSVTSERRDNRAQAPRVNADSTPDTLECSYSSNSAFVRSDSDLHVNQAVTHLDDNALKMDNDPEARRQLRENGQHEGYENNNLKELDEEDKGEDLDEVLTKIGEFGPYQRLIYCLVCVVAIPCSFNNMSATFFAATPSYYCAEATLDPLQNLSLTRDQLLRFTSPPGINGETNACLFYQRNYTQISKFDVEAYLANSTKQSSKDECAKRDEPQLETSKCTKWSYESGENSLFGRTIVTDWDLVCERALLKPTATSVYMAGLMAGVIGFGQLSDRLGRRPVFLVTALLCAFFMLVIPFSPNYVFFIVLRFLIASTAISMFTTAFVIGVELVGPEWRVFAGISIEYFWALGYMSLSFFAYFIRDWNWFLLTLAAPWPFLAAYYFILPESPRWLITKKEKPSTAMGWDCLRTPNMRAKSLNIFFNWLVNSCVYYGLSLNTSNLGGNPYINNLISGGVEIPAYIFCNIVLMRFGRRLPLAGCLFMGGLALFAVVPLPDSLQTLGIVLAMVGKFAISASFAMVYVYTAELFPTCVRNVGVGLSSMFARLGGIISPYIAHLGETSKSIPLVIFGSMAIIAGLLALLLPETKDRTLPDTIAEGEMYTRIEKKSVNCQTDEAGDTKL